MRIENWHVHTRKVSREVCDIVGIHLVVPTGVTTADGTAREVAICLRQTPEGGSKIRKLFLSLEETKTLLDLLRRQVEEWK